MEIENRTRYATKFEEQETENVLWRSGRFFGKRVVPEGQRPFPGREAVYEVVEVVKNKRTRDAVDAVFTATQETTYR